jgi:hypothetical protein
MAFLTQNKARLCKILIITLVSEKNAIFVAENCRKLQKIVIITSTTDRLSRSLPCSPRGQCFDHYFWNFFATYVLLKTYTLTGFEPGSAVSEAVAISTSPGLQGKMSSFIGNINSDNFCALIALF